MNQETPTEKASKGLWKHEYNPIAIITLIYVVVIGLLYVSGNFSETAIGNYTILGLAVIAVQLTMQQFFNKNLEIHKAMLQEGLEERKAILNLENVKRSKLYEKRLENIICLYKKLLLCQSSIYSLEVQSSKLNVDNAHTSLKDFRSFYYTNKPLFPKELCKKIDIALENYTEAWVLSFSIQSVEISESNQQTINYVQNKNYPKIGEIIKVLPKILEEIELEVRKIID